MFGETMPLAFRLILALSLVLGLMGLLLLALRRGGWRRLPKMMNRRQPRLEVMDVAPLDAQRRMVIIRRDSVEHLLLIGGPSDVVVERGIIRGVPVSLSSPPSSSPPSEAQASVPAPPVLKAESQPGVGAEGQSTLSRESASTALSSALNQMAKTGLAPPALPAAPAGSAARKIADDLSALTAPLVDKAAP